MSSVGAAVIVCTAAKQTDVCEDKMGVLICGGGQTIRVRDAWYGSTRNSNCRGDTARCNTLEKANKSIIRDLKDRCNRKSMCTMRPGNDLWGSDPCPGTRKLLRVDYDCK
ncbi:PREDICTED: adhesion G protein-coupled receptor L1-like [Priapulus caudatus]|uniref:Adhesion G protein-coupled receptor L1-like n=1 Tax=Priapulus caudatus TaxID=37621 RepID=A0ABM1DYV3_PRICU|nr:PREDICTED: adhesion G protein-coupled receptor L1-like [Priapulus caudatus]